MRRHRQALTRLQARIERLGQATGWDAPPPPGTVLAELAEPGETARRVLHRLVVEGWTEDGEPILSPEGIEALARGIRIQDHDKPRDVLWDPYDEQIAAWEAMCAELWVYILKGRQIGITMATLLFDVIWTAMRDSLGHEVHTALVWDTFEKAAPQLRRAASMIEQLGIPLKRPPTEKRIIYPNESRIVARAAASKGATRGLSFHRYHCSEIPFWPQATAIWEAMRPSLNLGAPVTFESTMQVAGDKLAADLWRKPNRFGPAPAEDGTEAGGKLFFSLEMHRAYRDDPDLIPDEQWEWLRDEEGFTRRDTAAWWYRKLQEEMNGDKNAAFREYPNLPRHAFSVSEGRYIKIEPKVLEPVDVFSFTSHDDARRYELEIFRRPEDTSCQLTMGIDTAGGNGGDRSCFVIVDKEDGAICACLASEWIGTYDYAKAAHRAWQMYQLEIEYQRDNGQPHLRDVMLLADVETNGHLGKSVYTEMRRLGAFARQFKTGTTESGTREQVMHEARLHVEAGRSFGPAILAEECGQVFRRRTADGKDGGWYGHDDCIMALGIAQLRARRDPFMAPPEDLDPEVRRSRAVMEQVRRDEEGHARGGL